MSTASILAAGFSAVLSRCSLQTAATHGRCLGRIAWISDRRHRDIAQRNLGVAFPERSPAWRRHTARCSFEQVGRTAAELLWSRGLPSRKVEELGYFEGLKHLEAARASGRGVLIASGHFGNWELMGLGLGMLGHRLHSIARPLDDRDLDASLLALRTSTGNAIILKQEAVRRALRVLRDGGIVVVLTDQNTLREDAVFVPFFGVLAGTTPLIAQLHLRTGATIIPAFAVPMESGYRFVIESPIVDITGERREIVEGITAATTARVEARVAETPSAWLWMHDRWRSRPT